MKEIHSALTEICQLFGLCIQRYALQCNSEGKFAQLVFGGDLLRAYRSRSPPSALIELLCQQLILFEEQCGTNVKTLAFFIRDLCNDDRLNRLNFVERRFYLNQLVQDLRSLSFESISWQIVRNKNEVNIGFCADLILDTLPREIFDRNGTYRDLLLRLAEKNFDRIDDYIKFNDNLSFVTTSPSIDDSRLLDGILIPVAKSSKLLDCFKSGTTCRIVFLNFSIEETKFSIIDDDFRSIDLQTTMRRKFVEKHLKNIDLVVSQSFIDDSFVYEFHRAKISVIDAIDETTFEFLLSVYRCSPCDRFILSDDERVDRCTTTLIDRYVMINQLNYIYLSSNDRHQTLLSCVPNRTLFTTTEKVPLNFIRLLRYFRNELEKFGFLHVTTEEEFLKFLSDQSIGFRSILMNRRIFLQRSNKTLNNRKFPICLFREYILNAIEFLCSINKIDGVYSKIRS